MKTNFRERVWSFSVPYYDGKNAMHNVTHIKRVLNETNKLCVFYPEADKEIIFVACCFHGFIYSDEDRIRTFLRETGISEEETISIIKTAWESQTDGEPVTLEGKIVHDAHLLEGGKTFLVVKSLVTGTLRGQTMEQSLEYMVKNVVGMGKCYLPEAVDKYNEKQRYLRDFLDSIQHE